MGHLDLYEGCCDYYCRFDGYEVVASLEDSQYMVVVAGGSGRGNRVAGIVVVVVVLDLGEMCWQDNAL